MSTRYYAAGKNGGQLEIAHPGDISEQILCDQCGEVIIGFVFPRIKISSNILEHDYPGQPVWEIEVTYDLHPQCEDRFRLESLHLPPRKKVGSDDDDD